MHPATPGLMIKSTPWRRHMISAAMAALAFPTPPAQATIPSPKW